jgi:hypothetical protein
MKTSQMDNFDLKKYLVENKVTTNSQLEEASALSIEPYTAENPSGEFEYKVLYYEPGKNQPTYQSLHKYLPTLSGAFLVLNSAKKIGVNTTDGKIANKVEPRTVVDKSGKTVDFKDESGEDARAAFSKAGYRDYTGNQVGNINEAVLSKGDFDLKKYLVENKVTTNSKMLSEITVKGKTVKTYKQNGDKSYSVTFEDDTTDKIYVSHDDWDTLHNDDKKKNESLNLNEIKIPFFHSTEVLKPFALDKPKSDQMADLKVGLVVLPKQAYRSDSDIKNAVGRIVKIDGDNVTVERSIDNREENRKVSDLIHIINWFN